MQVLVISLMFTFWRLSTFHPHYFRGIQKCFVVMTHLPFFLAVNTVRILLNTRYKYRTLFTVDTFLLVVVNGKFVICKLIVLPK